MDANLNVPMRRNSTYDMIRRALQVRVGLQNWLRTNPRIGRVKLGTMQFSDAEWQILQQICNHLERFEEASKLMSGEKYPTLSFVVPIFVELFSHIEH